MYILYIFEHKATLKDLRLILFSDIPVQSNSSDTENISSAQPNSKESVEVIAKEKAYTDKVAALKEKRDEGNFSSPNYLQYFANNFS